MFASVYIVSGKMLSTKLIPGTKNVSSGMTFTYFYFNITQNKNKYFPSLYELKNHHQPEKVN